MTSRPHFEAKRNYSTGGKAGPPTWPLAKLGPEKGYATRKQRQLVPATERGWQPRVNSYLAFTPWALLAPLLPASWPHTSVTLALGTEQRREGIKEESSREQVDGRKQKQ